MYSSICKPAREGNNSLWKGCWAEPPETRNENSGPDSHDFPTPLCGLAMVPRSSAEDRQERMRARRSIACQQRNPVPGWAQRPFASWIWRQQTAAQPDGCSGPKGAPTTNRGAPRAPQQAPFFPAKRRLGPRSLRKRNFAGWNSAFSVRVRVRRFWAPVFLLVQHHGALGALVD